MLQTHAKMTSQQRKLSALLRRRSLSKKNNSISLNLKVRASDGSQASNDHTYMDNTVIVVEGYNSIRKSSMGSNSDVSDMYVCIVEYLAFLPCMM
jgi:hypothetical protein